MTAKFITLEGGEGVGKTTNIEFIEQLLAQHKIKSVTTREPGGTPLAEQIRGLLLTEHNEQISQHTELLLMFAARAQHLNNVVRPALNAGHWVVCDRFTDASYAYQGFGRQLGREIIAQLEQLIQGNFRPDITLLLDAPVALGMSRTMARNKPDRIELEQQSFFDRVRQGYLDQAQRFPERIKIINADQPLTAVQQNIKTVLVPMLQGHASRIK